MRKRLLLLGPVCLLSTGALAADYLPVEPAPLYTVPLYDWTGFYAGFNVGFAAGDFDHPLQLNGPPEVVPALVGPTAGQVVLATGSAMVTAAGLLGGVQAGYNWQFSSDILVGLEADIQASAIEGDLSIDFSDESGELGTREFDAEIGTTLDWFATLRPRLGWVRDRLLVYVTGGAVWGHTTSTLSASLDGDEVLDTSPSTDRLGWTIGAGVEAAFNQSITMKVEYLYTDLGSEEIADIDFGDGDVPYTFSADSDVTFHQVRAGLNFHF